MKIGIYNQPTTGDLGGSEQCTAVLAEALAQRGHTVDIVHHRDWLTGNALAEYCGVDLSGVQMRYIPHEPLPQKTNNLWRWYRDARRWQAELSLPYNTFVNITHGVPPFCRARQGVLYVLFPFYDRQDRGGIQGRLADWLWQKRIATYQKRACISQFSQKWCENWDWWHEPSDVIWPPVDTQFGVREKEAFILSVGRFTTTGHGKKQREMVAAFAELASDPSLSIWEYHCLGGLSRRDDDLRFYAEVSQMAEGSRTQVQANLTRPALKAEYERASIFWHAAGLGEESAANPRLMEHFGISTVEAMAAGCVPVVIAKGGQPELVEHGVSGFVWNTVAELKEYTQLLARDASLRSQMAAAARRHAERFQRTRFVDEFLPLLGEKV